MISCSKCGEFWCSELWYGFLCRVCSLSRNMFACFGTLWRSVELGKLEGMMYKMSLLLSTKCLDSRSALYSSNVCMLDFLLQFTMVVLIISPLSSPLLLKSSYLTWIYCEGCLTCHFYWTLPKNYCGEVVFCSVYYLEGNNLFFSFCSFGMFLSARCTSWDGCLFFPFIYLHHQIMV